MKTTIDIADAILLRAKRVAKKENVTVRALVEEGLTQALNRREHAKPFKWKPHAFVGGGMNPEFEQGGWPAIRDAIYEGRGA